MKAKAISLLFLCVILIVIPVIAQQKQPTATRQSGMGTSAAPASGTHVTGTGLQLVEGALEGDPGSLYIGNDWPEGVLVLKGGKTIQDYRFRYDIYSDQMQFITGKDTLAFATPSELNTVTFANRTFVHEPYECSGMLMKGYFELLVPGKKQLLMKRSVSYHLPEGDKEAEGADDTYLVSECYFLKTGTQPAQKVMCNRKSALVAMGDRKNELEDYLKKTGNKVKNLDDLKKMVEYYNALE
jgi:hypothetical protein